MHETIWTETFRARYYEVGPDGCVTIQALCNYFQEAARQPCHPSWASACGKLMEQGQSWVLSRMLIEMSAFPGWRDEVTIDTWPAGIERMFAMRLFRLRCGERDDRLRIKRLAARLILSAAGPCGLTSSAILTVQGP